MQQESLSSKMRGKRKSPVKRLKRSTRTLPYDIENVTSGLFLLTSHVVPEMLTPSGESVDLLKWVELRLKSKWFDDFYKDMFRSVARLLWMFLFPDRFAGLTDGHPIRFMINHKRNLSVFKNRAVHISAFVRELIRSVGPCPSGLKAFLAVASGKIHLEAYTLLLERDIATYLRRYRDYHFTLSILPNIGSAMNFICNSYFPHMWPRDDFVETDKMIAHEVIKEGKDFKGEELLAFGFNHIHLLEELSGLDPCNNCSDMMLLCAFKEIILSSPSKYRNVKQILLGSNYTDAEDLDSIEGSKFDELTRYLFNRFLVFLQDEVSIFFGVDVFGLLDFDLAIQFSDDVKKLVQYANIRRSVQCERFTSVKHIMGAFCDKTNLGSIIFDMLKDGDGDGDANVQKCKHEHPPYDVYIYSLLIAANCDVRTVELEHFALAAVVACRKPPQVLADTCLEEAVTALCEGTDSLTSKVRKLREGLSQLDLDALEISHFMARVAGLESKWQVMDCSCGENDGASLLNYNGASDRNRELLSVEKIIYNLRAMSVSSPL